MPHLRMRDFWTFKPKEILDNKKYLFECKDATSPSGSSLLVKVAATHAGIVNSNHRFYRPDRMQDAAHQWVPNTGRYAKPVLFEHDKSGDVLGRVHTARYIDESYKWTQDFPTVKDSIFYKVGDKKVDLFTSVDWIVDNLMGIQDYSGLGYIELGLNVTNPDAISKVLRDEFLTVSVGFQTDAAICSVCHQNWATDDKCDHRPGVTDEESGKTPFLICGDFKYDEISFVNFPADPFAGKITKDALKDSINRKFFMGLSHDKQQAYIAAAGMSISDAVMDYDIQVVEDTVAIVHDLTKTDAQGAFEAEMKDEKLVAARALELKQNLQDWKPESEADKTKKRSLMSTLNAKIRKNNWTGVDVEANTDVDTEIQQAIETPAAGAACSGGECVDWSKEPLTDEEKDYFSDEEGLYAEMCVELDAAHKAGELGEVSDAQLADAKLSTEKRNKLGGSTFCGPNRSFPVPDCAHVTAARRLIGRAKVSDATKSKILSCVSGKAKSLGCGGKSDATVPNNATNTDTIQISDEFKALIDEQAKGVGSEIIAEYDCLNKHYKGGDDDLKGRMRHLHYRVGESWDAASSLEWARQHVKSHDKDSVFISSRELADKEEAVNTLTDELNKINEQLTAAKNTSAEMLKGVKKSLATQIVIYRSLTGHSDYKDLDKVALQAKVDELSKRHVTSLKDAVADIMSELKWSEAPAASANTVTEPGKPVSDNAQVDPPVAVADNTATETESEKLQKKLAEVQALRDKLRFMTPIERRVYMADLAYNQAKTVQEN